MEYECDNAFPNLKCVPGPFFLEIAISNSELTTASYNYMHILMSLKD